MKSTKDIALIIESLNNDKVVIIPTDTIYGYSCKIDSILAIDEIRDLKKRDRNKPFLILDSNLDRVRNYFAENDNTNSLTNKLIDKLIKEKIWPNNLTLISDKNPDLNKFSFLQNLGTVAVRYTDNKIIQKITDNLGCGILSTSINVSGEKELISYFNIFEKFKNTEEIIFILETNNRNENNLNSTIIKLDKSLNNDDLLQMIRKGDSNIVKKVNLIIESKYLI